MLNVIKYCLRACLYGIIFFQCTCFFGQKKITFENVEIEDFNEDYKNEFPSANAIILYRYVEDDIGNYIIVHERIKVINENGYEVANVNIPYGNVIKIEGATYNLVDGKVKRTELSRFLQGSGDRKIKIADTRKFTMPKVQVGSIIEYRYKATRGTNRDIAMQYPAGKWMTHRSGCWTAQSATRVLAKGSSKAGSGPMCATNGLGRGHRHRGPSIDLHRTGRKSTFSAIWRMRVASFRRTVTKAMPSFTCLIRVACRVYEKRPVGPICGATSMTSGHQPSPRSPARRSTGSESSTISSATSTAKLRTPDMPRAKS